MKHHRAALTIVLCGVAAAGIVRGAPVAARLEGQTLIATGRVALKQPDYGIKPVSVGGVVSVKDTVNISFDIVVR
jgi:hypothetical protein